MKGNLAAGDKMVSSLQGRVRITEVTGETLRKMVVFRDRFYAAFVPGVGQPNSGARR